MSKKMKSQKKKKISKIWNLNKKKWINLKKNEISKENENRKFWEL